MLKALKYIGIALVSLILLVALALILLTSPPGERWVKDYLESRLTAEVGLPVTIAEFETNLFSRTQARQLIMLSDTVEFADTLVQISHLRLGYSIPDLLGDEIYIRALIVDSLGLTLAFDSLGNSGIAALDRPADQSLADTGPPVSFRVDTMALGSFGAGLVDQRLPVTLQLFGAGVQLQGSGNRNYFGGLAVDSLCGVYDSIPLCIGDLRAEAILTPDTITITSVAASIAGMQWRAEGVLSGSHFDEMAITTSLEGDPAQLMSIAQARLEQPDLSLQYLTVEATVRGTMKAPMAQVRLDARQVGYGRMQSPASSLSVRYLSDSLLVDSFTIGAFGGDITGSGYVLTDTTYATDLRVRVAGLKIAPVWQAIYNEVSPYQGNLTADIVVNGSGGEFAGWTAASEAHASRLRYNDRAIPDLEIHATLADEIADLSFRHGRNVIGASLKVRSETLDGNFRLDLPEISSLAAFVNQPDLTGSVLASGSITGNIDNPSVRVTVDGSRISYRNFPIDTLHAEADYADSTLTISELFCLGRFDEIPDGRKIFDIDSLDAAIVYRCDVRGTPDSLSGSASADISRLLYGTYRIDSMSVRASLEGSRIELSRVDGYYDELMLRCTGYFDTTTRKGSARAEILEHSATISGIDSLTADTFFEAVSRGTVTSDFTYTGDSVWSGNVSGRDIWMGLVGIMTGDTAITGGLADFNLDFAGSLPAPDAGLTAVVRGVGVDGFDIDSVTASATLAGDVLTLNDLRVMAWQQSIVMSGGMALTRASDGAIRVGDSAAIYGQARIDDFDLSILQSLAPSESQINGHVSASVDLSGVLSSPHVTGWLTASDGRIQLTQETVPVEQLHVVLSLADSAFVIDTATFVIDEMAARVEGSVVSHQFELFDAALVLTLRDLGSLHSSGWFARDSLAFEVQGEQVDISVFQPFLVGVDSLEGMLSTNIRMAGSTEVPVITGSLTVSDLSLNVPKHFTSVRQGYAALSFDREHVKVDSLSMAVNGGSVSLAGSVSHESGEVTDIDLHLKVNDVLLTEPEVYYATVREAALNYSRQDDLYVLDGDIQLGETRLTARFRPQSILPWVSAAETVEWEPPELVARSRLDIRLKESGELWVDNNLARIRMLATVGIIGTPIRPNLNGQITIEEGYLLYLDRRFRVNEGRVYFSDPLQFNPDVLLDASTQVTSYRRTTPVTYSVFIRAEGLLDQLQVAVYSEPPLDKPDIVALLTLGATRTDLAGKSDADGSGGLKNVLADRAAMLTSRRISSYVSTKAGSAFGFDEFTIQGNLFQFGQSWGPQLVASRRLSNRVDMTYTTRVGHLNDQSIQLGYRLTRRLSLQSETDSFGRAGFDLKYGFKFR